MKNLNSIITNLTYNNDIWYSKKNITKISYPKDGNLNCFEIETNSFWFEHRNKCIIEVVKSYSKDEVFFDIGGGNGFVAQGLESNNIECVVIEPGIEGALNSKKRGLKNIVCSTLEDLNVLPNSIKSVGLFDVIEHIENDTLFLEYINSIMASKGHLYITVPAYNFLWSYEDNEAGHHRRYTKKSLRKILENRGFKIEYSTYIFSILPIPIFIFRTLPTFLKFKKSKSDLEKQKQDHSMKNGIFSKILKWIFNNELNYIKKKKIIQFGGSCLIVAKKK